MAKEENKRESEFDRLVDAVRGTHSKRLNAMLLTMDDEDFPVNYFKILEYVSPKLMRQEIIQDEVENKITIEHVFRPEEDEIQGQ